MLWNLVYLIDYFVLLPLMGVLPVPLAYRLARWRGRVRSWWNPSRIALAHAYARKLLGEQEALGVGRYLEVVSCDELDAYLFLFHPFHRIQKYIHVEGEEYLQAVKEKKTGAVLLGAHLGGGFFISPFLHALRLRPQAIIRPVEEERKDFSDLLSMYLYLRLRAWCLVRAIGAPPLLSGRGIDEAVETVRQGTFLWIAMDVPPHLTRRTKQTQFFGRPARFPYGPFVIAARAQVPVLPFFTSVDDNNHRTFRFLPPIWFTEEPQDMERSFHRCIQLLEEEIRARPDQWFFWEGAGVFFESSVL